jgi:hypothetical protein
MTINNDQFDFNGIDISIDGCTPTVDYIQQVNWPWYTFWPNKSAREQVQDEILSKIALAVESDDFEKAKELLALAKQLKEL